MNGRGSIARFLCNVTGEESCGVSCSEAEGLEDEKGWKMMLEGLSLKVHQNFGVQFRGPHPSCTPSQRFS